MPFLGKTPLTGEFKTLDPITCDGSATYDLTFNSTSHLPGQASRLIVSLNGVIQSPGSSYTTDGSTITFSTTLDSNNTIDFITALGEVGNVVIPADGSVTSDNLVVEQ